MKRVLLTFTGIAAAVCIMAIGGVDNVARSQSSLPAPTGIRAAHGSNPGEVVLSWNAVADATYYRVGWMADADYQAAGGAAGPHWSEEFRYSNIGNRGQSSRTVTNLTPGITYYFIVGAGSVGEPAWSQWDVLMLRGDGSMCPGTGQCPHIESSEFRMSDLEYQAIDAGKNHTCGIKLDNTIECWGDNTHGQTNAPEGQFLSVSAGGVYSCGIDFENQLACWGHAVITAPPDGDYTHVSVGDEHACAITVAKKDDSQIDFNRVVCWGLPNNDGRTHNQGRAGANPGPPTWNGIAAGSNFSCAILPDWWRGTHCWGYNTEGLSFDSRYVGDRYRDLLDISAGSQHICGLYDGGAVICRGNDVHNQTTGVPSAQDEGAPVNRYAYRAISAGGRHSCGLRTTGNIRCWGDDLRGQATPPGGNDESQANLKGVGDFTAVSAGDAHTCGLRQDRIVVCWGENNDGQADPL